MTEEFAFDEVFREYRTVEGNKGFVSSVPGIVNSLGNQFLPDSRFTKDKDSGICGADFLYQLKDLLHGTGIADNVFRAVFLL